MIQWLTRKLWKGWWGWALACRGMVRPAHQAQAEACGYILLVGGAQQTQARGRCH